MYKCVWAGGRSFVEVVVMQLRLACLRPHAGNHLQTHFVTSITYGAKVYVIFELECSDKDEKTKVSTNLNC